MNGPKEFYRDDYVSPAAMFLVRLVAGILGLIALAAFVLGLVAL